MNICQNEKFVEAKNAVMEQEIVASIQMQIEFAQKVLFTTAYNIGKKLVESKEVIRHGEWENWVEARLPFKLRAAENYMKIYKEYKENEIDNSSVYPSLGYSQALALIAVPSDEREEFAKQVNAKDLTIEELKSTIKNMQVEQNSKEKELAKRLEASITKERERIESLEKDKAALDEQIKTLQKKQTETITKIREEEKQKREQEISRKNKELETAMKKANSKIEELKERNSIQKAKTKEAEDIAKVSRELVKAEVLLSSIEADYESLTIILKKLQRTYPDHVIELRNAISDVLEKMEKKGRLQVVS